MKSNHIHAETLAAKNTSFHLPFAALTILTILFVQIVLSQYAHSGLMEISYTYSTRNSFIDDGNYSKSESHTGSFAWYFIEQSALELSYTKGEGEVSGQAEGENATKYITQFEMYDASLILTIGARTSSFQPYVKGGAAWIDKKIYRDDAVGVKKISETDKGEPVPSWGVGFRFFVTKNISIKASYDAWKAGEDSQERWDNAVRAGLSLMF